MSNPAQLGLVRRDTLPADDPAWSRPKFSPSRGGPPIPPRNEPYLWISPIRRLQESPSRHEDSSGLGGSRAIRRPRSYITIGNLTLAGRGDIARTMAPSPFTDVPPINVGRDAEASPFEKEGIQSDSVPPNPLGVADRDVDVSTVTKSAQGSHQLQDRKSFRQTRSLKRVHTAMDPGVEDAKPKGGTSRRNGASHRSKRARKI